MPHDPFPTPYDGSAPLFRIGVTPLVLTDWIAPDGRLAADLAEKARLLRERRAEVFAAEPATEAAQAEVLALLVAHLCETFSALWRNDGDAVTVLPTGDRVALDTGEPALIAAARLVQDDLVLMRRGPDGWRLAAAALCFPSSWRLGEKFGRLIHEVHGPVPGFGPGTRSAEVIARMFDAMRPETPMLRWNWSLYGDDRMFHPEESPPRRFGEGPRAERVFLRVERQALRKLPVSGDILFTVRVRADPLAALAARDNTAGVAAALIAQIGALTPEQLTYKGLGEDRDRLLAELRALTTGNR